MVTDFGNRRTKKRIWLRRIEERERKWDYLIKKHRWKRNLRRYISRSRDFSKREKIKKTAY
ncbi:MAG: hypothetical protein J6M22_06915 [Firmicutes bacterium]|nr:hypothetical protein [Bacillota bacterium]